MDPISDIVGQGRDAQAQASKIYGVVIGIVANNKDADLKLGRIKVKFPWLADTVESYWARLAYPMGGKERGYWWIPEIDDEVLVVFEHGDPNRPFVLGGLYNGVDKPPKCHDITSTFAGTGYEHGAYSTSGRDFNEDGKNDLRFIRSRSGHLFIFDDKADAEKITLADKTGEHRIEIFTKGKRVVITSAGTDGDIELIAERKIWLRCKQLYTESREETEMWAKNSTFLVKSKGDMTHKTDANMVRDAKTNIDEKAGSAITYKSGAAFSQEAGSSMSIKSTSSMSVKGGSTTEVTASASMTIKGATVDIN